MEGIMKKIRIAQIGVNRYSHALSIFNSLKTQPEIFDIAGYCLVEGEKERFEKELFVFNGYPELTLEEILNDPSIEAVTVETEEIHLTKYAIMAAEHGKMIHMEKPEAVEKFCKGIQFGAPVDSFVTPVPWAMPGYDCPVIMAAGAFIQGASIELSADGPIREPYAVYFQGGLTWYHAKLGILMSLQKLLDAGLVQLPA